MTLTTANGTNLHPIGIGTWGIASRVNDAISEGHYGNVEAARGDEEREIEGLRYSIERGQNHIDCAEIYGAFYTDEVVGRAVSSAGAKRDELFIADKLWKHSVEPTAVRPTVEQMLTKLGTDYLDLLYIHAPWPGVDWATAISQIDILIDEGVVRHFGVSNFTIDDMRKAESSASHSIAANQVEFSPIYRSEVDEQFRHFCAERNIAIVAYSPLKRGKVLQDETIQNVASRLGRTPGQVSLAWLIQLGALPIPKAIQKSHIDENLEALTLSMSKDEMQALGSI